MNAAAQGDKALSSSNLPLAIQHFTQALTELPRAPAYYISRSTAYTRLKPADGGPNPQAALRDAEIGLTLARERGKRELMLSAQMRRAISLYQLGRYGDAAFVLGIVDEKAGASSVPEDKSAGIQAAMSGQKKGIFGSELPVWLAKVRRTIRGLPEGDEKLVVSVVEIPTDVRIPTEAELKAELEAIKSGKGVGAVETAQEDVSKAAAVSASSDAAGSSATRAQSANGGAAASGAAPEKVRHEWYQSQDSVVVTLYIKGIPKDSVTTDLKEDSVSLQFPLPSGSEYDFTLDPLYATIDPSASKVSVMGTKIEITLQKQKAGQKWSALEGSSTTTQLADRPAAPAAAAAPGPSYPTSSRKGTKDWDQVASSLTEKKSKGKDAADDDASDDEFGGDAVDGFFKKLYANADPETRRAMIKSYTESQGTSLSTNWSEVGKGKVEAHPPS
ncbi:hypothetical protein N7467_011636 [Penicillium canescens]|nr:hypothetical protein N7467_011636 [Penicillium canescens]